MKKYRMAAVLAAAFSAFAIPGTMAQDTASTLTVRESPDHGRYIADGEGMALYMFEADTHGVTGSQAVSTCYDECAEAWPPLITQQPRVSTELDSDLLGTIERRDGRPHVTYDGWPLYRFVRDQMPGDTGGHDVEGFGAEWYLVSPDGEPIGD